MNTKTDRIQVRVDPDLKMAVEAIFNQLGLSSGEAIRMFYSQVELSGGLPFPVQLPNSETIAAMEATKNSADLKRYKTFAEVRREQGV